MTGTYLCKCGHESRAHGEPMTKSWGVGKCGQCIDDDLNRCDCKCFEEQQNEI
jgi:hypothetical protein